MLFKPDMHHTCLCIMAWLCSCIYHVVCFFPVLLLNSGNVAIVRIRSSTPVRLLHGLVLLPCGITGKMTIPSKSLLSLLARLLALLLCLCCDTHHLLIMPPILLSKASNHLVLANHYLAMLPLCSAPLIALLVAREDEVCSLLEHGDVVLCWTMFTCWDITIYLI